MTFWKTMDTLFSGGGHVPVRPDSFEKVYDLLSRELGVHAAPKEIRPELTGFVNHDAPKVWRDGLSYAHGGRA
jgi:hypothetical protein